MLEQVREVVLSALHLDAQSSGWQEDTPLLGGVQELDSMAVIDVIAALEDRFGIHFVDDEVTSELFATLGTLSAFVAEKCRAK